MFKVGKFWKFVNFPIHKISEILNFDNSNNFELKKFQKFVLIYKISQFSKIAIIDQFWKFTNFQNSTIWNINKFWKFYNLKNQYFTISKIIKYFRCSNNF